MDYILAPYNREDQRITPLREGIERDTTYICLLLHSHDPTGFERVLDSGRVQCTCSISRAGSHKSTRSAKLLVQSRIADMRSRSTYSRDAYCSTPPTRPPQAPQKAWAHTPGPPISSATKSLDHAPLDHRFYSSFFPIVLYPIRLAD